jgi:hypothetical protein
VAGDGSITRLPAQESRMKVKVSAFGTTTVKVALDAPR